MKKYQQELDNWFKEKRLEILVAFVHLYGDKPKKSNEKQQELEEEIGDIIYTLICFCQL